MSPKRVQMSRQHPWRADNPDAVIVARPSRWGNPFKVGENGLILPGMDWPIATDREPGTYGAIRVLECADRAQAVEWFRAYMITCTTTAKQPTDLEPLRGRDLACWCPLDRPCHADVLLEIANP